MKLSVLPETIRIDKLAVDQHEEFYGDQQTPWINNLTLQILEEGLEEEEKGKGELAVNLSLVRRTNIAYGDHLIAGGQMRGEFTTHCVRCLGPMEESLETEIFACFLPKTYEKRPDFQEITSIYADKAERDIYFYENRVADIEALVREYFFININPFPIHRMDCKGLCPVCGINLNFSSCKHEKIMTMP